MKRVLAGLVSVFMLAVLILPTQPTTTVAADDPVADQPLDEVTFSKCNMTITNLLYGYRFFTDWKSADNGPVDLSGTASNGANNRMAVRATINFTALHEDVNVRTSWTLKFRLQSPTVDGKYQESQFYDLTALDVSWIDENTFEVCIPLADIGTASLDWTDVRKLYIAADLTEEYRLSERGDSPDLSMTISNARIVPYEDTWDVPEKPDEEPLLTIACLSDLHTQDNLLTGNPPHPRGTVINTLAQMKETENIDVMLIGGDVTSNSSVSQTQLVAALKSIQSYTDPVTKNVLWVAGNHDYNAGDRDGYNSAPYYDVIMKDTVGELAENEAYYETYQGREYMLAYHYVINGFDFVCLNTSHEDMTGSLQNTNYRYTSGMYDWVEQKLAEIGADKTIFVMGHLPIANSKGLTDDHKQQADSSERMCEIFKDYPNLIYLYGHDHSGNSNVYIKRDTAQRVTVHDSTGAIIGRDGDWDDPGFITSFMGSMRYSNS